MDLGLDTSVLLLVTAIGVPSYAGLVWLLAAVVGHAGAATGLLVAAFIAGLALLFVLLYLLTESLIGGAICSFVGAVGCAAGFGIVMLLSANGILTKILGMIAAGSILRGLVPFIPILFYNDELIGWVALVGYLGSEGGALARAELTHHLSWWMLASLIAIGILLIRNNIVYKRDAMSPYMH
ncbi:hypothetical protein [Actinophytocola sp.]|uniref:hypothetical protein n=1 Tax=Actinophytocola sp. TaxID=1872138 RepID=UPI002D2AD213|nr:hypothetical protein [Actinophytocola sp.]HYQ66136.1 hypothetical protein [Actinophytocola sp.]